MANVSRIKQPFSNRPLSSQMPVALQLTGIRKTFDGFVALDDASFSAQWGEVHALLGENGAGKSSLMNIAAGLYAPEAGQLLVDDNPVRLSGPSAAARHHIGMVHQHFKLVRPFTVAENILLGNPISREDGGYRGKLKRMEEAIRTLAAELGFEIDPARRTASLSVAEQQRVHLAPLGREARIVQRDETVEGLAYACEL